MKILFIVLSFFAAVLLIALSVRLVFCIRRCRKTKMLLSGDRGRDGFLYALYSMALGGKCYVLKDIYVRCENNRDAVILCVPLLLIGSGGILIAEEKHMCGFIEDPMRGDWRQFHGNRIVQFNNPLEVNSKRIKALERLIKSRGFKVPMKGIVVFTQNNVRLKNRLSQIYSAESSIKCIRSFMDNKYLTAGEMKSLCSFIRRQSLKISNGNNTEIV